ncbi:MAG: DUF2141 domain-containing protein [Chlorobiaceae bacterium]|nr:DUF2141 domain-containing protein [Chlorobiaceae bacterium]
MNLPANTTLPDETQSPGDTGRIVVRVFDVRNLEGELGIALFSDKHGFPGKVEQAFRKDGVTAIGESNVCIFENVPYGLYAVAVMHDETRSGELHYNFFGIPKEGVGASSNPSFFLGPPSFDCASFQLNTPELEVEVHLKYLCS